MSSGSDRLTTAIYLVRHGDDVHTDNLFSQDRLRVDAVEPGSKFCVLGQGLKNEKNVVYFPHALLFFCFCWGGVEGRSLRFDALDVDT